MVHAYRDCGDSHADGGRWLRPENHAEAGLTSRTAEVRMPDCLDRVYVPCLPRLIQKAIAMGGAEVLTFDSGLELRSAPLQGYEVIRIFYPKCF